jgi:hypothetical protein
VLTDKKAIEIVSTAKQKNVRDPKRSRLHFENIFDSFFSQHNFSGDYLDMGPGQYDFGVMAKERGADQCYAIENDPPVIELGKYLGFEVLDANIKLYASALVENRKFSGVFNKFSYNCFWYLDNPEAHINFVDHVLASLSADGWAWIAPWNGVPKSKDLSESQIETQLELEKNIFQERGFDVRTLSDKEAKKFGVHGVVANSLIFTFNL